MFSNYFDIIIKKINKNIILIYFQEKNILKSNRYHNDKLDHNCVGFPLIIISNLTLNFCKL
jgi:hypothetical protein